MGFRQYCRRCAVYLGTNLVWHEVLIFCSNLVVESPYRLVEAYLNHGNQPKSLCSCVGHRRTGSFVS